MTPLLTFKIVFIIMLEMLCLLAFTFCLFLRTAKSRVFFLSLMQTCGTGKENLGIILSLMSFFPSLLFSTPTCSEPQIVWSFNEPATNSLCLRCLGLLIIGGNGWVFSTLELLQKKLNKNTFAVVGKVFDVLLTFPMFIRVESLNCH